MGGGYRRVALIVACLLIVPMQTLADGYAESVALTGHSADGDVTFDVRIARFPSEGRGTLWFYVYIDGAQYALVENELSLPDAGRTDVSLAAASFAVAGDAAARLDAEGRDAQQMSARLEARGRLHATAHPGVGSGAVPVTLAATFQAQHAPIRVRPGRLEVMGRAEGTVTIAGQQRQFSVRGKWHEQTGTRPNFAPAFTYFFVQSEAGGMMAIKHAAGAWGYVLEGDEVTPVEAMRIDGYGGDQRAFMLALADGRQVHGSAEVLREVSVPIEGQRRPGATVVVSSDLGELVGVINDWDPQGVSVAGEAQP